MKTRYIPCIYGKTEKKGRSIFLLRGTDGFTASQGGHPTTSSGIPLPVLGWLVPCSGWEDCWLPSCETRFPLKAVALLSTKRWIEHKRSQDILWRPFLLYSNHLHSPPQEWGLGNAFVFHPDCNPEVPGLSSPVKLLQPSRITLSHARHGFYQY